MTTLRYGIVGTGMMGIEHIENVLALEDCEVVAFSDPDEGSRSAGTVAAPGAAAYQDHRDMLEGSDLDVVVVVSPNHTHVDVLGDLLVDKDLHLLVEKPLCTTVEDCDRVIEQADGRSGLVWMGLEYRYMPPVARLIDEVKAGAAGNVKMVSIREHRFPFLVKVGNWNRFSRNTGGTLVEKCCHFFDLMRLLVDGEPTRVMASGAQDVNHLDEVYDGEVPDILDNAFVVVDFDSGQRALLDLCMFAEATRNQEELVVVGDEAKLEALIPDDVLRIGRRGQHWIGQVDETPVVDTSIAHVGLHHGASYVEHRRFAECIRNGTAPDVTLADGRMSVAMGVAAHRSIEQGRIVEMSEIL